VSFTVSSTPGYGVWIDRTTNLMVWSPLTNLVNPNGELVFTDSFTAGNNAMFYRTRQ
jgi:hypothetical protein